LTGLPARTSARMFLRNAPLLADLTRGIYAIPLRFFTIGVGRNATVVRMMSSDMRRAGIGRTGCRAG
jgi:hypothetical protein